LRRLKVALICRGVPEDFCEYIAHDYSNLEPAIHPSWAALKSNPTTPMDSSDSTFNPNEEAKITMMKRMTGNLLQRKGKLMKENMFQKLQM